MMDLALHTGRRPARAPASGRRAVRSAFLVMALLMPAGLGAQVVAGTVPGGGRWIVDVRDEAGTRVARGVSTPSGAFALAVPGAGPLTLEAAAPGWEPVRISGIAPSAADTTRVDLPTPRPLSALPEPGPADLRCAPAGEFGPGTAEAWRRVRVALALAREELEGGTLTLDALVYRREFGAGGDRVVGEEEPVARTAVSRLAPAVEPADLLDRGFIRTEDDGGFRFFGPSVEVLLSSLFDRTHCLRLRPSEGGLSGLAFEPVERDDPRPDVAGVIWLETATGNPVLLEFGYRNTDASLPLGSAGGRTTFAPLPDGSWITVEGWMTLPLLEARMQAGDSLPDQWSLGGLREEGFRVTGVRTDEGAYTLDGPTGRITGVVRKHPEGLPLGEARVELVGTPHGAVTDEFGRFEVAGLLEGTYTLRASHPELDELPMGAEVTARVARGGSADVRLAAPTPVEAARLLCGDTPRSARTAGQPSVVLSGQVSDSISGEPLVGVPLTLRFRDPRRNGRPHHETRIWTGSGGEFLYCDLPPMEEVRIRPVAPGLDGRDDVTFFTGPDGVVRRDLFLALSTEQNPGGVFGTVREFGTIRGIEQAQVRVKDTDVSALTNRRGFFAIPDLPQGLYVLEVSALGYETREIVVRLSGSNAFNVEVELSAQAIAMEGITVTAVPRRLFGDMVNLHRRMSLGGGTFVMKAELETRGGNLAQILQGRAGVRIVPSPDRPGGQYIVLRRARDLISGVQGATGPGADEAVGDIGRFTLNTVNCYPAVWVDNQQWSQPRAGGVGHDPVDITEFLAVDLEAIEIYRGAGSVPGEFGGGDAACGAIVIWTRRGGVTLKGEAVGGRGGGAGAGVPPSRPEDVP